MKAIKFLLKSLSDSKSLIFLKENRKKVLLSAYSALRADLTNIVFLLKKSARKAEYADYRLYYL